MKKTILLIVGIIVIYIFIGNMSSKVVIQEEAIRIRIIANSNSEYDQHIKKEVKNSLENNIYEMLKNSQSIEESRNIINNNLSKIDSGIKRTLQLLNNDTNYTVNFGLNYFPPKEYKGVKYNEGYYESLVVTLGKGEGDNWWCVLFPPLCLLEAQESTEVEYKSYVKELIDKYF